MENNNIIGKKIRLYRQYRGLNQIELAEAAGINVGTIRKYELGLRNPKPEQLVKIASALNLNVSVFLDIEINTVGDVLSLLFAIDNAVDLSLSSSTDNESGAETISFTFRNPHMQDYIKKWCEVKKQYENEKAEIFEIKDEKISAVEMDSLENSYLEWQLQAMSNGFSSQTLVKKGINGASGITPKIPDLS